MSGLLCVEIAGHPDEERRERREYVQLSDAHNRVVRLVNALDPANIPDALAARYREPFTREQLEEMAMDCMATDVPIDEATMGTWSKSRASMRTSVVLRETCCTPSANDHPPKSGHGRQKHGILSADKRKHAPARRPR